MSVVFFILLIFSINLIEISTESDSCHIDNPCRCQFENGTGIDLKLLATETYLEAEKNNLTFFFHPCSDIKKLPAVNDTINDCSKGYSICLQNTTTTTTNNKTITNQIFTNLGVSSEVSFKVSSSSEAYLIYTKPNKKITTISLVCTNIALSYFYAPSSLESLNDNDQINLILFSPHACFVQLTEINQLSTGSKLVILFFVGVLTYLGLGMAVKFFLFGARNIEVIPNLEFWQDFPKLLRDGARFVQNGCKVDILKQDNQESYDAI